MQRVLYGYCGVARGQHEEVVGLVTNEYMWIRKRWEDGE